MRLSHGKKEDAHCSYSTGHRHCSITRVFHAWKSAIIARKFHEKNPRETLM